MFDRRTGEPRFTSHDELCRAFGIQLSTTILLTGTDRDPPLERWWGFGEGIRRQIIRSLRAIGTSLVTTPNYSLFIDRPRWDDFHAMKRIAIIHEEFLREGLAAALHVNGRTETDFDRWTTYIAERPEITHIAYEFATGTGRTGRREQHTTWLTNLAAAVDRPLHLIVRGGTEILPILSQSFENLTFLDTSTFMKTMMRQQAYPKSNAALGWRQSPTAPGALVDDLFAENSRMMESWVGDLTQSLPKKGRTTG